MTVSNVALAGGGVLRSLRRRRKHQSTAFRRLVSDCVLSAFLERWISEYQTSYGIWPRHAYGVRLELEVRIGAGVEHSSIAPEPFSLSLLLWRPVS